MNTISYLHLDSIKTDHHLMRLLPREIAYRYQALPIATDGYWITVAMASPEDIDASAAVKSAIGAPICLVQADPKEIDQRLDELWKQNPAPKLRLLLWNPTSTARATLEPYARLFAEQLDADFVQADIPWRGKKSIEDLICAIEQILPDVTVFQNHNPKQLNRVLLNNASLKKINRLTAILIIPQKYRWPLAKILLTIPDTDTKDESAIDWTIQLARSGQSEVTVLPLLPPVPGWYGSYIQHGLQALLKAEDPMGTKMRLIAKRFKENEIIGTFKLREGEPLYQLRDELIISDPDLVIIPSPLQNDLRRWMTGELVNPLLTWANRPVLISKENISNP